MRPEHVAIRHADVRGPASRDRLRLRRSGELGPRRVRPAAVLVTLRVCRRRDRDLSGAGAARRRFRRALRQRDDRCPRCDRRAATCCTSWSWSVHRRATSMARTTSAASPSPTSRSCLARWRATISGGPVRWPRRSWAIADRPALGMELVESFCRTDPEVARQFAARDVHVRQPG